VLNGTSGGGSSRDLDDGSHRGEISERNTKIRNDGSVEIRSVRDRKKPSVPLTDHSHRRLKPIGRTAEEQPTREEEKADLPLHGFGCRVMSLETLPDRERKRLLEEGGGARGGWLCCCGEKASLLADSRVWAVMSGRRQQVERVIPGTNG